MQLLLLGVLECRRFSTRQVWEEDVADRFTENARIPDPEIPLVGLVEAVLMDVVPAAAELEEGSLGLQYLGEDVLVAEVPQEIRVALLTILADDTLDQPLLLLDLVYFQHLLLLGFNIDEFLLPLERLGIINSLILPELISLLEELLDGR